MEKATFAAGCFWGVEAAFRRTPGVAATRVGYAGGTVERPTYEDVCTGRTGHAEAVEVAYDPERVSYDDLLEVFWSSHDPTTRKRRGPDLRSQYRSMIFTHSAAQGEAARRSLSLVERQRRWRNPVGTQIEPVPAFHEAEEHHQRYLEKRGRSTCTAELAQAAV